MYFGKQLDLMSLIFFDLGITNNSYFNISISPEKEIVMILAKADLVDAILKGLYASIGTATQAQGIAFALPVDEVVGLDQEKEVKETKE